MSVYAKDLTSVWTFPDRHWLEAISTPKENQPNTIRELEPSAYSLTGEGKKANS